MIKYIPEEKRGEFIREIVLQVEHYSGIIPHPSIVGRWERIMPGSAERILSLSEKHQEHRMDVEHTMFGVFAKREQLGMWFYFIIALVMIVGGTFIILSGHSTAGLVALAAPIATLAGSFIYNHHSARQELREKRESLQQPTRPPALPDNAEQSTD
ncbi:MAG: DUF2335 domain-containing protein [Chloroflexota bacterium]|nr:DUF2335 domain-containing protein [Chloroflexota bacterium]